MLQGQHAVRLSRVFYRWDYVHQLADRRSVYVVNYKLLAYLICLTIALFIDIARMLLVPCHYILADGFSDAVYKA